MPVKFHAITELLLNLRHSYMLRMARSLYCLQPNLLTKYGEKQYVPLHLDPEMGFQASTALQEQQTKKRVYQQHLQQ